MLSGQQLDERVRKLSSKGSFAGYEVLGRIATGGMAELLLARKSEASRPVVIKRILPYFKDDARYVAMFETELDLTRRLEQSNLPRLLNAGKHDGFCYLVLEWIDGASAERLLARLDPNRLPVAAVVYIGSAIADALDDVHQLPDDRGESLHLVHRDVSPHNIMLGFLGDVVLLDFGIARTQNQRHKTLTGVVKGSYAYTSPEQCTGDPVDQRSDLFSLGVCLVELLTGRAIFKRASWPATMNAIVGEEVPPLRELNADIPVALERVLLKALAKKPEHRFSDARAMAHALCATLTDLTELEKGRDDLCSRLAQAFQNEIKDAPCFESAALNL